MKYYIIAGEASGDLHGSNLMKGIYAEDPEAEIRFWGGDLMAAVCRDSGNYPSRTGSGPSPCGQGGSTVSGIPADLREVGNDASSCSCLSAVNGASGCGLVRHYRDGAIMGFTEVLAKAGRLLGNVRFCKKDILAWKPDAVILIDYPGFNFKIAEFAHKHGIKTFYYIAPKVWASREGRIRKLKKYVDRLFIVFPFEIPYFTSKGVDFIYRGNPLVDAVDGSLAMRESRQDFFSRNGLDDRPYIALLAGSRKGEINTMMPVLMEYASKLHRMPEYSGYRFIIAGAPARTMADYSPYLGGHTDSAAGTIIDSTDCSAESYGLSVKVLFGETQSIIRHAEAAVVNSGTASLETALLGTPQVVGYIMGSRLTYWVAKQIVKIRYISLGNLVADRFVFKEFIQDECTADNIIAETRTLIEDNEYRAEMLRGYAGIRNALGGSGASRAVAKAMTDLLKEN